MWPFESETPPGLLNRKVKKHEKFAVSILAEENTEPVCPTVASVRTTALPMVASPLAVSPEAWEKSGNASLG
jgi:hypothetical protein